MQLQFRNLLPTIVTFLTLILSLSSPALSQGPNLGPARYNPALVDRNHLNGPYFEAQQAQERLAQAQRSNAMRSEASQPVRLLQRNQLEPQQLAQPDAPDQSDLLKNSKDPDYILKNFRTMWVDAREAQYFDSYQMKAALGRNKEFRELNIRVVDDPRVADVLLHVGYTFAWDYPFQLKHQNTTMVLLAGKGQGPLSGPLGAADVAREFVNAVKRSRTLAKEPAKTAPKPDEAKQRQDEAKQKDGK